MAIDLLAIETAVKTAKEATSAATEISKEVRAHIDAKVERKEKIANGEHNRGEDAKQKEFERKEKVKTNAVSNVNNVVSTIINSFDTLTCSIDRLKNANDRRTKINNDFVIEMEKINAKLNKSNNELQKTIDKNRRLHKEKMKSLDDKHAKEMYELETQRITALEIIGTIKEACMKLIDILDSCRKDDIIDISVFNSTVSDVRGYLSSINSVPLLFTQKGEVVIQEDDD